MPPLRAGLRLTRAAAWSIRRALRIATATWSRLGSQAAASRSQPRGAARGLARHDVTPADVKGRVRSALSAADHHWSRRRDSDGPRPSRWGRKVDPNLMWLRQCFATGSAWGDLLSADAGNVALCGASPVPFARPLPPLPLRSAAIRPLSAAPGATRNARMTFIRLSCGRYRRAGGEDRILVSQTAPSAADGRTPG